MHRFLNLRIGLTLTLLAVPSLLPAKTYQAIKGESGISYRLHHPMHEIEAMSTDFNCTVDLDNDTAHSLIHVKAGVVSFSSGHSSRDSHMLEIVDGFKYPFVEFISDSVRHEEKGYRVSGKLNFHGVTRSIDFVVTPEYLKDKVRIKGGFVVKLSDFKLERPSFMFVPTSDELKIDLDVMMLGP